MLQNFLGHHARGKTVRQRQGVGVAEERAEGTSGFLLLHVPLDGCKSVAINVHGIHGRPAVHGELAGIALATTDVHDGVGLANRKAGQQLARCDVERAAKFGFTFADEPVRSQPAKQPHSSWHPSQDVVQHKPSLKY